MSARATPPHSGTGSGASRKTGAGATRVLGGRYRLTDRIAVGGMGEVWRATDDVLGRQVAVKLPKAEYVDHPGFLERFRAEARHSAPLSHPGIASVYDYGEDGDTAYLVMELVEGQPLSTVLAREGPLAPDRAASMLAQAANALQAAHVAGVIHRDVKPGNLLIEADDRVRITDFGIARAVDAVAITATGETMGTAQYVSPEQASGKGVTPASDLYSLAVVGYEMLVGHPPFADETPIAMALAHVTRTPPPLPDSVPAELRHIVDRGLEKDPARRFPDGAAFAAALRAARGGSWTGSLPTTSRSPAASIAPTAAAAPTAVIAATTVMPVGMPVEQAARPAAGTSEPAYFAADRPRRGVRWTTAALVTSLLVMLLAVAGWAAARDGPGSLAAGSTLPADAVPSAPVTVVVDPALYVGRNAYDVVTALQVLGLTVETAGVPTEDAAPGTVVAVEPSGTVGSGSTVIVSVAEDPDSDDDRGNRGKKRGED